MSLYNYFVETKEGLTFHLVSWHNYDNIFEYYEF